MAPESTASPTNSHLGPTTRRFLKVLRGILYRIPVESNEEFRFPPSKGRVPVMVIDGFESDLFSILGKNRHKVKKIKPMRLSVEVTDWHLQSRA
jgi:hypothetical protein